MNQRFDVIVVGAGNGGLAAAATCAKAGLKTLVLERHNIPGGCATSFVRGRFEFEASLHELCSVGTADKPQEVYSFFSDIGAEVDWRYEHTMFRAVARGPHGHDVRLGAEGDDPREAFCDAMERAVPGCRDGVRAIFALKDKCDAAVDYIYRMKGKPNKLVMATKHADFMRVASHSVEEVLVELGLSQKARELLCTYWGYLGVPTDELKAFHYFNMLDGYVTAGAAMPAMKSHELSESIAKVIYDNGGKIFYNTPVTEFVYDAAGAVKGVVAGGRTYEADAVVSDVIADDVWNLSPAAKVPDRARRLSNARDFGISVVTCYLGLDCTADQLGVKDYTVFVQGAPTARGQYDTRLNKGFYIVNCLNKVVPESSPEGTCTLFFTMACFGSDVPDDLAPEDYKAWKNAYALRYIKDYEALMGIDILSHVEEVAVATPVTFARYLGTPEGTIYGYKTAGWDNIMARISSQAADNCVGGLSFVGGSGTRGDGYSCAYITGADAGKRLAAAASKAREEAVAAVAAGGAKDGE